MQGGSLQIIAISTSTSVHLPGVATRIGLLMEDGAASPEGVAMLCWRSADVGVLLAGAPANAPTLAPCGVAGPFSAAMVSCSSDSIASASSAMSPQMTVSPGFQRVPL